MPATESENSKEASVIHGAVESPTTDRGLHSPADGQVQELVLAPPRRHPWRRLVLVVLLLGITAATTSFVVYGGNRQSTNDAYVEGRVVRISPKVSGEVLALRVDDNTPVRAGDVL